jgi:hypothetical protein
MIDKATKAEMIKIGAAIAVILVTAWSITLPDGVDPIIAPIEYYYLAMAVYTIAGLAAVAYIYYVYDFGAASFILAILLSIAIIIF